MKLTDVQIAFTDAVVEAIRSFRGQFRIKDGPTHVDHDAGEAWKDGTIEVYTHETDRDGRVLTRTSIKSHYTIYGTYVTITDMHYRKTDSGSALIETWYDEDDDLERRGVNRFDFIDPDCVSKFVKAVSDA